MEKKIKSFNQEKKKNYFQGKVEIVVLIFFLIGILIVAFKEYKISEKIISSPPPEPKEIKRERILDERKVKSLKEAGIIPENCSSNIKIIDTINPDGTGKSIYVDNETGEVVRSQYAIGIS